MSRLRRELFLRPLLRRRPPELRLVPDDPEVCFPFPVPDPPLTWWRRIMMTSCSGNAFRITIDSLQWRHNGRDCVSNHQPRRCLLNRPFRRRSKKTSKPRVTGLCAGNSPMAGEFPAQMASTAENVSIWWRHYVLALCEWNPPLTGAFTSHRPVMGMFNVGWPEQAVEQTTNVPVIWYAITLMWRHSKVVLLITVWCRCNTAVFSKIFITDTHSPPLGVEIYSPPVGVEIWGVFMQTLKMS